MNFQDKIKFSRGLHELIDLVLDDKITSQDLSKRLYGAARWVEEASKLGLTPTASSKKRSPSDPSSEEIRRVFDYWQATTKRPRARLTPTRKQKIKSRLSDGFSVKDLCSVVDFVRGSEFHQGLNDTGNRYDWIENIFRSTEKVEQKLELIGEQITRPEGLSSSSHEELDRLQKASSEALKEGRIGDYNQYEAKIKILRKDIKSTG